MAPVKDALKNPYVKLVLLILGIPPVVAIFGWAIYVLRDVLVPFALAFIVAYILDPVVDILERRKIPRALAIALLTVGLLAVLAGGTVLLVLDIQAAVGEAGTGNKDEQSPPEDTTKAGPDQGGPVENVPEGNGPARGAARENESSDNADKELEDAEGSKTTKQQIKAELHKLAGRLPERFRSVAIEAADALCDYLAPRIRDIVRSSASLLAQAAASAWSFVAWVFKFALFVVVTLYLLNDIDRIREKGLNLLPPQYKPHIVRIARKIDADLRSFFRGQLLVAFALTVVYLVGLMIAGVPYALPVAIIGGIGNFVPYLGTFLGLAAGAVASVTGYGFDVHLLYVLIVFVIGQALEGNIITPKIVGKSVGLSPVAIIFSILVFGRLLGFFGVLFAVPLASTVKVFVGELLPRIGLQGQVGAGTQPPDTEPGQEKGQAPPGDPPRAGPAGE